MAVGISSDDIQQRAVGIRMACFDVDGTLTDGRLFFNEDGTEIKAFHVHDGQGLRLLEDSGITVALITARESQIVRSRGQDLRLRHVYTGVSDKLAQLERLCAAEGISLSQVAYMGDDFPDLACLQSAGLSACPRDALPVIRNQVHWISDFAGGSGAARQFCDLLLLAQGKTDALLNRFGAP
jgi:3-deoxy-D-manno-octulosonate 8-phosphate phosphatase (KDO 8-P phosphatase)